MSRQEIRIAIVGDGLSDLSAAALFDREGHVLTVYEQTPTFTYLGAGIHFGPNLARVLEEPGIADRLKAGRGSGHCNWL
jgi:6-hydroxynicotinate 3-monooxygenase